MSNQSVTRRVKNLTPETYSATNGKKRKRSRPPLSCQPCRLSKIACDRKKPCSSCSRQARPGSCAYVDPEAGDGDVITNNPRPTSLDSTSPSSRDDGRIVPPVAATNGDMTGSIKIVVESLASGANSAHATPPVISTAFQQPKNATASAQSKGESKHGARINPHSEGALVTKIPGTIYYIGRNGWTLTHHDKRIMFCGGKTFADQWAAFGEISKRFKGWRSHNLLHCTLTASVKNDMESEMLRLIPEEREVCDVLARRFLITFNATHPVVDSVVFEAEVEEFWVRREVKSTMWLGLFIAILALGYQLPVIPLPEGVSRRGRAYGRELTATVRSFIFASPAATKRPDYKCFQLLLLLILSQSLELDWVDGNDVKHGLLSLTSRLAFTMGLHRDPSFANGITATEARLRRMLWTTYKFIDLEHCMQSGVPFLLREADSDVETLHDESRFWPGYRQWLVRAMPIWARVVQLSHSTKAGLPETELSDLQQDMDDLALPLTESFHARDLDSTGLTAAAIQCAVFDCCHSRMMISLYGPSMNDPDATKRIRSRRYTLKSARTILAHQVRLHGFIEDATRSSGDAWAHFIYTLFHCHIFNATEYITFILRMSRTEELRQQLRLDTPALFDSLHLSRTLMDKVLAFSPCFVKGRMISHALVRAVEERLRTPAEIDINTPAAEPIIRAMLLAGQESLEKGKIAIDEALKIDDPPAALCGDVEDTAQLPKIRENDPAGDLINDFATNDWAMDADTFPDLCMPSWFPLLFGLQRQSLVRTLGWMQLTQLFELPRKHPQ